jgi:ATP-dependent RNA helicase RhlE
LSKFSDFGLAAPIIEAVAAEGYTLPTPIQAQAIPQVLSGRDLCGIAQTGTGQDSRFRIADSPAPLQRTGTANSRHLPSARAQPH